ncbi:MAG: hypothetical protein E7652_05425 [Ruminococcaceae bacterium]|nr:hypothetical protein [Oscillospiraceae bacterium]
MNSVSTNNSIIPKRSPYIPSVRAKQTTRKSSLNTKKVIIYTIIAISVLVVLQLLIDTVGYYKAISSITEGNYTEASVRLGKLEGFRDSESLKEYCDIMSEYNAEDFSSVYRSYRGLMNISKELDNHRLSEHFIKTFTEVETLYNNYDLLLYVK